MSKELIDFSKLQKTKWYFYHRRFRTPFYQFLMLEGLVKHYNNDIILSYELRNFLYLDQQLVVSGCFYELGEKVKEQLKKNDQYLLSHFAYYYDLDRVIKNYCKDLGKVDWKNISKNQIIEYFKKYVDFNLKFGSCILVVLSVEKYLDENLKLSLGNNVDAFRALTTPIKSSAIQDEEISLLEMKIKKDAGSDVSDDLSEHIEKFSWLKNNSFDGKFYSREEIVERLDKIDSPRKKLADYKKVIAGQRAEFDRYYGKIRDDKMKDLVDTIQESIFFRSWRTERYYRNAYYLQGFFEALARFCNLENSQDIFYLSHEEILETLLDQKAFEKDEIKRRKIGYVIYINEHHGKIYSGPIIEKIKDNVRFENDEENKKLSGMVAYVGKATGRACIVNGKDELGKICEDDILVAHTTTPDYAPYIKRVKAIVTEEGGILSHASVISRELHIPCIIGTKTATKMIKDGDIIEVDAIKNKIIIKE